MLSQCGRSRHGRLVLPLNIICAASRKWSTSDKTFSVLPENGTEKPSAVCRGLVHISSVFQSFFQAR